MEYDNYLMHHGTKGQRWGYRHFQFPDGTWTELGKARRRAMSGAGEAARRVKKAVKKTAKVTSATIKRTRKAIKTASDNARARKEARAAKKEAKIQKRIVKALGKNDMAKLMEYKSHLTYDQLAEIGKRAENLNKLSNYVSKMPKKQSVGQKVATDLGKYVVDKGLGLAQKTASKAGNAAKAKATASAKDLFSKAVDAAKSAATTSKMPETWSYDELRKKQENSASSRRRRKKEARRQNDTENWLRSVAYEGPIFRDVDGAHNSTKWYNNDLSRVADQYLYEREKKKRYNNYVWHGMKTRRRRK